MKKKIIYVIECMFNSGGMERILSVCANALSQDFDVSILTLYQKGRPPFFPINNRIKCLDLGLNGVANKRLLKKRLSEFFMEHRFDFAISLGGIDMNYLHSIKDESKKLIWFHFAIDIAKTTWAGPNPNVFKKTKAYLQTWRRIYHARKYDKIIVISRADLLAWGKYTRKATLIYNPVTISSTQVSNWTEKKVISVGRLDFQKGFDYLIDAWQIVASKHSDWHLNIYGDGALRNKLEQQIQGLKLSKYITLCGRNPQIECEYPKHSIYVMSSRAEGFGLVLVEAAACGLPLIAFDCPSGPSEIIEDEKNGFLIKQVGDVQTMADKVCKLIEDNELRKQMGYKAKEMVEQFGIGSICKQWKKLLG